MCRNITTALKGWADSGKHKTMMIDGSKNVGKTYSVRKFGR